MECLLDGEKCVCEIIDKLKKYEQAHISKSLIKLKDAGILKDRKNGLNVYYSLSMECIKFYWMFKFEFIKHNIPLLILPNKVKLIY